jgi:hypothetical protein
MNIVLRIFSKFKLIILTELLKLNTKFHKKSIAILELFLPTDKLTGGAILIHFPHGSKLYYAVMRR